MLQSEFTMRTQIWCTTEQFEELHKMYMSSPLDRDAWCKQYKRKHELDITIADIHSGNEESAINRLESRVGSPMMSDVCRGFVTLIHGDVAENYWSTIAMKFADINRQRLKAEAAKVPKKVKRLSMCMLICFMLIYVVVILEQIVTSMGILFQ